MFYTLHKGSGIWSHAIKLGVAKVKPAVLFLEAFEHNLLLHLSALELVNIKTVFIVCTSMRCKLTERVWIIYALKTYFVHLAVPLKSARPYFSLCNLLKVDFDLAIVHHPEAVVLIKLKEI